MTTEAPKQIPTPKAQKVLRLLLTQKVFTWSSAPAEVATCVQVKVALCQLAVSPDKDVNIHKAQKAIKVFMQPTSLVVFCTKTCLCSMSDLRVGCRLPRIQCSMSDLDSASSTAHVNALQEAAQAGAKLVILPEMWNCPYSNESFPKYAEDIEAGNSRSVSAMSDSAKEAGITLVAGSIPESSSGKLYNTCCIFDEQGKLLAKHRKVDHVAAYLLQSLSTEKGPEPLTADCCCQCLMCSLAKLGNLCRCTCLTLIYPGRSHSRSQKH